MTKSPLSNLPGWDIAERIAADDFEAMLRAAFNLQPKYTLPSDPHADQLARDVVRDMGRTNACP